MKRRYHSLHERHKRARPAALRYKMKNVFPVESQSGRHGTSSVGMCEFFVIGNIVFRVLVKHVVDGWFTAASSRISQPSQRVAEGILAQRRAWQASNTNKVDTIPRPASLVGNEMAEVGATD